MATIDEDLATFIKGGAAIAREVGGRVHENHVPLRADGNFVAVPFVYFVQTGEMREDCLGDAVGTLPLKVTFALEVVAQSISQSRRIGALIRARCHLYTGTLGSRTIQCVWCEDQSDGYQERAGAADRGFHTSSYQMEVAL